MGIRARERKAVGIEDLARGTNDELIGGIGQLVTDSKLKTVAAAELHSDEIYILEHKNNVPNPEGIALLA